MIQMCRDLHQFGLTSRYLKHFGGPVYELKDRTRDGGARVYLIATSKDEFILVHAECKTENAADASLLEDVANVLEALEGKRPTELLSQAKRVSNSQ